jgi:hypothetical protein
MRAELPAQVEDLVAAIRNPFMQIEFLSLLRDAKLLEPVLVDAETATRMVGPTRGFSTAPAPKASSCASKPAATSPGRHATTSSTPAGAPRNWRS